MRPLLASLALVLVATAGALLPSAPADTPATAGRTAPVDAPASVAVPKKALAGRTIVLDPGHQLGNRNFPAEINKLVDAGHAMKPCNTTGTATNAGLPEATVTWRVAKQVRTQLRRLGATVVMTRSGNSDRRWGPCVDVRGRAGNKVKADLLLSIHADGSLAAGARGFHVIAPGNLRGWTDDIRRPSRRLARDLRKALREADLPVANYIAGGDGLDVRTDLGTLNHADVPAVMVELGNMRSSADASLMSSRAGRTRYARALVRGVRSHLG